MRVGWVALNQSVRTVLFTIAHQTLFGHLRTRKVTITRTYDKYTPKEVFFYLALLNEAAPGQITLGAAKLADVTGSGDEVSAAALAASPSSACYFSTSL